jgi:hypothetical protein
MASKNQLLVFGYPAAADCSPPLILIDRIAQLLLRW